MDKKEMIKMLFEPGHENDPSSTLAFLTETGILDEGRMSKIIDMKIKKAVDAVHNHRISCAGEGKRWFTRVNDPLTGKSKTFAGSSETNIYERLYDFYYGAEQQNRKKTLLDYYPDWLKYKMSTDIKSNSAKRYDQDFRRYYKEEPLSQEILKTPVCELKTSTLKTWAYQMIKKYDMDRKQYGNCVLILNQMLEYLVENEVLKTNVFSAVKIKKNVLRRTTKKPAETQVFQKSERSAIIDLATQRALQKKDESFLAIPLMFMSGLRIDECLALSFSDFDLEKHAVFVHASLSAVEEINPDGTWETRRYEYNDYLKGNADSSYIDVPDTCFEYVDMIKDILKNKGIKRGRLFDVKTPNNVEMKLYRICDSLNITRRSPHKTRKTYISTLINEGVDMDYVRTQARHKDLSTTLRSYVYSTATNEEKIAVLNQVL